eukprot:scaffold23545_cov188-Skeletonema_dohrnii-CCMP3373.AAC.1
MQNVDAVNANTDRDGCMYTLGQMNCIPCILLTNQSIYPGLNEAMMVGESLFSDSDCEAVMFCPRRM